MSFIRRQSYKKTLEFACLLGKKWLIKKNVDARPHSLSRFKRCRPDPPFPKVQEMLVPEVIVDK